MRLRVAPIVEGHGEVQAMRVLLQRIGAELLGGVYIDVLQPFRQIAESTTWRPGRNARYSFR